MREKEFYVPEEGFSDRENEFSLIAYVASLVKNRQNQNYFAETANMH